jgi:hypothetical protein
MSLQYWEEVLVSSSVAGPTLTAAAAASCIPTPSRIILPNNYFQIGKRLRFSLFGKLSNVVTTPGTARFDVRMGPSGTIVVFDTLALNLNIVAKTDVPWWLDIDLMCQEIGAGTSSKFMGLARFTSEAVILSPLPAVGGIGTLLAPVAGAGLGTGFDNTAANAIDVFFTQTAATGSLTVLSYRVESLN